MVSFSSSTTIERSVEDVFAVMSNPANDYRWSSAVVEAKLTSPGPVGVGSTAHYVGKMFGRRYDADWDITEFEPNRRFVARSRENPVAPVLATMTFEPLGGGTRVTVTYDTDLPGPWKMGGPFVVWYGKRRWDQALRALKDLMEAKAL